MIFRSKDNVFNKLSCSLGILLLSLLLYLSVSAVCLGAGLPDTPFIQEYHKPYPIAPEGAANDVRAIVADNDGNIWAATKAGIYRLNKYEKQWIPVMKEADAGPAYDIIVDNAGTLWAGTWNGLYQSTPSGLKRVPNINHPIPALCASDNQIIALGPGRIYRLANGKCTSKEVPYSKSFRAVLPAKNGGLWIATGLGLYHHTDKGYKLYQSESELVSPDLYDIAFDSKGSLWIGSLGGITVYKDQRRAESFTPKQGLPSVSVRCVAQGPDGIMWVGTGLGIARYNGKDFSIRHSKRWLVNDDVHDIAFDSKGTAWIATAEGVSAIKRKSMTLAEKADYFLDICLARHVREPYLVEKCLLTVPGDTSNFKPRDDDNDGQYTAMYLAMESFRYAATKDPRAKANAKKAFEALRFLQTVTRTPGFVARTVIPSTWKSMADPNRKISDRQWAEMYADNPREKRVETRWHPSRDGKWLWKSDTSSDEITGHMFGYLFYYDLVADGTERKHVCKHILNIVDYIIDNGYILKGIDGTHTKWGVWSPQKLNYDSDWKPERGVNSVEILSFLKLAYHVSGYKRYQEEYLKLLHKHNYADNVKRAKTYNHAWRTHIDDELLALAYPCLLMHEDDPKLLRLYRESLDHWYTAVKADCSPFFNFIYGACIGKAPQLKISVKYLRDASLDLVRWTVDNSHREDHRMVRIPELEMLQTNRLLPPDERGVIRWDENPWKAVQGDGGYTESDGVWWLLPYWAGRYYGYINPPQ
ncbi:MAG: two-component regulator propeller domain-containing protein [Sedimentisphaerales bacterium]|nr:two-component regulator propeller domain-containing protein [Sedimentisphaerales bacterium]